MLLTSGGVRTTFRAWLRCAISDVVQMRGRLLSFLLCIALLYGCGPVPVPTPPENWAARTPRVEDALDRRGAKLQIMVTYDAEFSTHAALRLDRNGTGPIFWDPAGRYGEIENGGSRANLTRINDLIVANPPTVESYWESSVNASDIAMEVFEWSLSDRQAAEVIHLLLAGAGIIDERVPFQTKTSKPFCSIAISDFLRRLEEGPVQLSDSYLIPHRLAQALYAQGPDRVVIFRRGRESVAYSGGVPKEH